MILYNGSTGGLGRYLEGALSAKGESPQALRSRLESRESLRAELTRLDAGRARNRSMVFMHLAANVSVPACEKDPEGAQKTNVVDTVETMAEVFRWAAQRRLALTAVYVSSGHVYASQREGLAAKETDPVAPRSVYARTKLDAEGRLTELARREGRSLVVARVFGLIAPKQPAHYVLPGLIRRALEERLDGIPGLSFFRDYLDARDVCDTLIDLARAPAEGRHPDARVFNVCSGRAIRLRDMLERILLVTQPARAHASMAQATEAAARPDDVAWLVGDPTRVSEAIGRNPQRVPLERTIEEAIRLLGT